MLLCTCAPSVSAMYVYSIVALICCVFLLSRKDFVSDLFSSSIIYRLFLASLVVGDSSCIIGVDVDGRVLVCAVASCDVCYKWVTIYFVKRVLGKFAQVEYYYMVRYNVEFTEHTKLIKDQRLCFIHSVTGIVSVDCTENM